MTFLFIGGEEGELSKIGACAVDTTTTTVRRPTFSRCSLKVAGTSITDGWHAKLSTATTAFWVTGRAYFTFTSSVGNSNAAQILSLVDSTGARRLTLLLPNNLFTANSEKLFRLVKTDNAGTVTTLVTSTTTLPTGAMVKFDVYVNYAVAGNVQIYVGGVKIIDYSGDVTTNGVTTLAGVIFGQDHAAGAALPTYWSEIIASTTDTRGLSLATLPPLAAGNVSSWTGTVAEVNETTLSDSTLISSSTANQVSEFTVTKPSVMSETIGITAIVVTARAQKGDAGPQNLQLVTRTGGVDYTSGSNALGATFTNVQATFTLNPATGLPWTPADINAVGFNVGVKSIT